MTVKERGEQVTQGTSTLGANDVLIDHLSTARREQIDRMKRDLPIEVLKEKIARRPERRPFREALVGVGTSIIAEFKRRSPTRGDIRPDADLASKVTAYENGGAVALSVLAEEVHFGGRREDLSTAHEASSLPILYKDFVLDPYQLSYAAAYGADAVLLIAALLPDELLHSIYDEAASLDIDCLVEVHNEEDLERVIALGADVIGINNRLSFRQPSFEEVTSLDVTKQLAKDVPTGKTVVSESGIESRSEIEELESIGVDAFLIGTHLMLADDSEMAVRSLTNDEQATREHYLERASEE
jgi:indole-3-glycerol phosphate synthase